MLPAIRKTMLCYSQHTHTCSSIPDAVQPDLWVITHGLAELGRDIGLISDESLPFCL